jgi:hypothetical protein
MFGFLIFFKFNAQNANANSSPRALPVQFVPALLTLNLGYAILDRRNYLSTRRVQMLGWQWLVATWMSIAS